MPKFTSSILNKLVYSETYLKASDIFDTKKSTNQAKNHIAFEKTNTIADGLRAASVGKLNYPILMSTVDQA